MKVARKREILRVNQNPSRFRQFMLWFKPSWKMSFEEWIDHYHRLDPAAREKLRELSGGGRERERFRFMAKKYRKIYGPEDNIIDHKALVEGLKIIGVKEGSTVVSYGAGNMHQECFLAKEFPHIRRIIGVEPLEEMRLLTNKVAFNILGTENHKIRSTKGFFEDSPEIADGSADIVISNEAFQHVKKPEKAVQNMTSKIAPGGGLVIVYRPYYSTKPPTPEELSAMLERFGMKTVRSRAVRTDRQNPNNNIHLIVARKINRVE